MERAVVFCLVFPILFGILVFEYRKELGYLLKTKILAGLKSDRDPTKLVIGIMSARSNYHQRAAIRDTWLGHTINSYQLDDRVKGYFIIGQPCVIHPLDRADFYTCVPLNLTDKSSRDEDIYGVREMQEQYLSIGVNELEFRVRFPIIVTQLGIHKTAFTNTTTVKLIDASTQNVIASATFIGGVGNLKGGYIYKAVETFVLPQDFEAIITAESISGEKIKYRSVNFSVGIDNSDGVIHLDEPIPDDIYDGLYVKGYEYNTSPLVSFVYRIHDINSIKHHIQHKSQREASWKANMDKETTGLLKEAEKYGDFLFSDDVDVYRNLPKKLLFFYNWVDNNEHFHYLLKTDDDCLVNIQHLYNVITQIGQRDNTWWGRFRYNWAVETYGKWRERDYISISYPPFACGSGNILSYDVVHWLAQNSKRLKVYQGEDTSLGIWTSATNINYLDDPRWRCYRECQSSMFTMPELTPEELREYWSRLQLCGDPCGCG